MIAQVLTGSKNKKVIQFGFDRLPTYNLLSTKSSKEVSGFIDYLIATDYIAIRQGEFPYLDITEKGLSVLKEGKQVWKKEEVTVKTVSKQDPAFESLRELRKSIAAHEGVPPFMIFSDETLHDMCRKRPETLSQMLAVKGIGQTKLAKFGEEFLAALKELPPVEGKKLEEKSFYQTYLQFSEGKELIDIAKERGLSISTVEQHIFQASQAGYDIEWKRFLSEEEEVLLTEVIEKLKPEESGLKAIKEQLPDAFPYFKIKVFLAKNR